MHGNDTDATGQSDVDGLARAAKFVILSAQRSGSNWLSQRLQMLPEVTMVGEDPRLIKMEGKVRHIQQRNERTNKRPGGVTNTRTPHLQSQRGTAAFDEKSNGDLRPQPNPTPKRPCLPL